jgi:hypothetical protein
VTIAAAIGGGLAGCHPTGLSGLDVAYGALLAALVTLASSRASRSPLLVLAAVAVAMSRGWLWAPAGVTLALAFGAVFPRRAYQRVSVLIGALAVQVVLRWPPIGFHGSTALVAALAITPVLISGWRHQPARWRKLTLWGTATAVGLGLLLSVPVAVSGLAVDRSATNGINAAHAALTDVGSGNAPAAEAQLHVAAAQLGRVHRWVGGWWNVGAYLVPVVSQQDRTARDVTAAGRALMASAAQEAGKINFHDLRYSHGQIDLAAISALSTPLQSLDSQIAAAQTALGGNRTSWLVGPLSDRLDHLRTELTRARSASQLAASVVKEAPALLGADGVRHYFVAFMTPAETRGLGGFIGAYGELSVDHGHITLVRSGRPLDLTLNRPAALRLTGPADYLARYGRFAPQANFEDVSYSPDFPSVANVISQIYPQVGGDRLDGVLMLDPNALAALLGFTGPISIPGLADQLTAANAADILLRQQYLLPTQTSTRHDLLQDALAVGFARLVTGSLPAPKTLAAVLGPEVRQGRLLFWSNHPGEQPLLQGLGLSGAFPSPRPGSDLLAVTVANAANNKIDAYLHEQISDHVQYNPSSGHVTHTVTIRLDNAAPSTGMPLFVIGSYHGSGLPPGTNYMWLTLYSPLDLTGASVDGRVVGFSPAVDELGTKAYSTFLTIPAESSSVVTVALDGSVRPGPSYQLSLRLQPLANAQSLSVSAQPVSGWSDGNAAQGAWVNSTDQVQRHTWFYRRS